MKYMGVGIIVNLVWVTFIDNESIHLSVFVIITSSVRPFYFIIDRGGFDFGSCPSSNDVSSCEVKRVIWQ